MHVDIIAHLISNSLMLQASDQLRLLTNSWGRIEAAMAAGLHDMSATMLAALPWDERQQEVAYRHMPEVFPWLHTPVVLTMTFSMLDVGVAWHSVLHLPVTTA